jgi:(2Fe-2S) ferredoxin
MPARKRCQKTPFLIVQKDPASMLLFMEYLDYAMNARAIWYQKVACEEAPSFDKRDSC